MGIVIVADVGAIRKAIEHLPDSAGVLLEDNHGTKYEATHVWAIGKNTDAPGLILSIVPDTELIRPG